MPDTLGWRRTGTHGNNVSFDYGVSPTMPDTLSERDIDAIRSVHTPQHRRRDPECVTCRLLATLDPLTADRERLLQAARIALGVQEVARQSGNADLFAALEPLRHAVLTVEEPNDA